MNRKQGWIWIGWFNAIIRFSCAATGLCDKRHLVHQYAMTPSCKWSTKSPTAIDRDCKFDSKTICQFVTAILAKVHSFLPHQVGEPQDYRQPDERWMANVAIEANQLRWFIVQWWQQVTDIVVHLFHPKKLGQVHDNASAVNDSPSECVNGHKGPPKDLAGLDVHIPQNEWWSRLPFLQ